LATQAELIDAAKCNMPVQRKVFRIEQMSPAIASEPLPTTPRPEFPEREIIGELQALRALIEARPARAAEIDPVQTEADSLRLLKDETGSIHHAIGRIKQELAALQVGALDGGRARAARELEAVAEGAERATQQIIDAAEDIEDLANTLAACLKVGQEQALAQDIQDHVMRIFEACNFQDLSGQRISKVIATLNYVDDHIARMMQIWGGIEAFKDRAAVRNRKGGLQGPRLNGDSGHTTQDDVDALFALD
jgi:chemotaxis protein CheZ